MKGKMCKIFEDLVKMVGTKIKF